MKLHFAETQENNKQDYVQKNHNYQSLNTYFPPKKTTKKEPVKDSFLAVFHFLWAHPLYFIYQLLSIIFPTFSLYLLYFPFSKMNEK